MSTKRNYYLHLTLAAFLAATPFAAQATVFFSDTFGSGSTLTNTSPANPTTSSTAYQYMTAKAFTGSLGLKANDLRLTFPATASGIGEIQALFSTNPIVLAVDGDFIEVTVTFTNVSGLLTNSATATLGLGLYNSGGINGSVKPVPGGMSASLTSASNNATTGNAQNWKGYFGYIVTNGTAHKIYNRNVQSNGDNRNQGTVTSGTSNSPQTPAPTALTTAVSASPTIAVLLPGTYTEVLAITRNGANSVAITNSLYTGPSATGSPLVSFGAIATNANYLTSAFDAFSYGYRLGTALTNDISAITVDGSVTVISLPPTITQQPVAVTVATGGACPFIVTATGNNVIYQWRRNGTNLLDGGNISGSTTSMLVITNAGAADALSGANGYYCIVSELGGASTNTVTNSLALVAPRNLIWNGAGNLWDLANSLNWNDPVNPTTFNYGDAVTFDDTGAGNANVVLNNPFLSASTWLVTGSTAYAFNGPGYFAGSGQLVFNSSAGGNIQLLNVTNIHTGGTVISNLNASPTIYASKYQNLGNGPLILAKTNLLEIAVTGSASLGIAGDVVVNDDFTIQFDGAGAFGGVFLKNISGTSGKTLSLVPQNTAVVNRYRVYGTNTACNANIAINPNGSLTTNALYDGVTLASYQTAGVQFYNGVISGFGGILVKNSGSTTLAAVLNNANTYSGGTTIAQGILGVGNDAALGTGQLSLAPDSGSTAGSTGTGTIFAYGGARTIANAVNYPSGTNNSTLIVAGTNSIAFTANIDLNGLDNTGNPGSRTITVNNTGATTFSGNISDSSANAIAFVKNGTGVLYLNGANTFAGITTNSAAGRLAGSGSLAGSVEVQTNAAMGGGTAAAIGTLSIGGNLTFENGGGGYFRLNKSNGQTSDRVAVTGLITNFSTGTNIVVTNLGPTLVIGDSFTLFNQAVTNGNTWKVTGGLAAGLGWTNKLAANGTIQVVQSYASYSTNISYTVSGSTLIITWPATHQGWFLQSQTNTLGVGLSTNWATITGSDSVISTNLPIVPGNPSVFYRLKMP